MKKIFTNILIVLSFVLFITLCACGTSKAEFDVREPSIDPSEVGEMELYSSKSGIDEPIENKQLIYYRYDYTIEDKELETAIKAIANYVKSIGGYIEDSNEYYNGENNEISNANYTFRIPSDKAEDLSENLSNYNITYKNVDSTNITEEYTANESRIEVLEASRASYISLLENEKLSFSEIIAIEDKVEDIDTELTYIKNIQKRYEGLLNYSVVNIRFTTKYEYKNNFFADYFEYLGDFFVGLFKFIMYSLPVVLVLGSIACAIVLPINIRNKKRKNEKNWLMSMNIYCSK